MSTFWLEKEEGIGYNNSVMNVNVHVVAKTVQKLGDTSVYKAINIMQILKWL